MPPSRKKPPPYKGPRYPIDEEHSASRTVSVAAADVADAYNMVTYRKPYDFSQPEEVAALRHELGPDAVLPDGDGVFYLIYVTPGDQVGNTDVAEADKRVPVLLPEGHAHLILFGVALADSLEAALRLVYRKGILPLDDPGPS